MFAYNIAKQETTGFTPSFLVHGRVTETTIDAIFPFNPDDVNQSGVLEWIFTPILKVDLSEKPLPCPTAFIGRHLWRRELGYLVEAKKEPLHRPRTADETIPRTRRSRGDRTSADGRTGIPYAWPTTRSRERKRKKCLSKQVWLRANVHACRSTESILIFTHREDFYLFVCLHFCFLNFLLLEYLITL